MNERKVDVYLDDCLVGTLAETADRRVAFAYSDAWLESGFAISPFSLPVEQKVFVPSSRTFHGLWGVFADSLPDAWGRLLVDRMLKSRGLSPADVTPLERLAIVGASGMGALTYRPAWDVHQETALRDLDDLSEKCRALLNHEEVSDLDTLFQMGGSSGGARPKVMTDEWVIKFPASGDMPEVGLMEKDYMDCAASCGIAVPETRLMPSRRCSGYFAVRRFDREKSGDACIRRHMLTAAAILEVDWRTPSLDYHTLMKLTRILSRSNALDTEQMFRRMCFNVFAYVTWDSSNNLKEYGKTAVYAKSDVPVHIYLEEGDFLFIAEGSGTIVNAQEDVLTKGVYPIGKDLKPGSYLITLNDFHNYATVATFANCSDLVSYISWDSANNLKKYSTTSVSVKKGEQFHITLVEGECLFISDGTGSFTIQ